jgi:hypothetical protein
LALEQKSQALLALEMEAAALYAFNNARRKSVLCFAHVTNQMALVQGDFEKGEAHGTFDLLAMIAAAVTDWQGEVSDRKARFASDTTHWRRPPRVIFVERWALRGGTFGQARIRPSPLSTSAVPNGSQLV